MNIDAFLKAGWSDHADHPQDVADRLAASLHLVQTPDHFAPFARLLTHVYGEHLGLWGRGVELLESLRGHSGLEAGVAAARPIDIGIAARSYGSGNTAALDALPAEDQVLALASASSALAARDEVARAIAAYALALRTAQAGPAPSSPAMRALAVGGNNLAATLEGKSNRSASESQAMLAAAQAALVYWKRVGTWIEEERAEYRLARSLLQVGEPLAATQSAERCAEVCKRNDAPPIEQFFAHAVLALAHRASGNAASFEVHRRVALSNFDQTSEDERKWCENERKELEG
jgi:hypothetical protein